MPLPVFGTTPVITLLGSDEITLNLHEVFTEPGYLALDDEDGNLTASVVVAGDEVDPETVGDYVITYDVTDSDGNAADQVTRTVHIVQSAPVIVLMDGNVGAGKSRVLLAVGNPYIEPGYSATDEEDGDLTADVVVGGDTVDSDNAGDYTITYDVQDSDGRDAEQKTRLVRVSASAGASQANMLMMGIGGGTSA